jgi:ankyrin repeat protein
MKISKSLSYLRSDKLLSVLTALAMLTCLNAALGDEIHDAAKNGDVKKVKALLETAPKSLNEKDDFGKTPLHLATTGGYKDVVALLLEKGADADIKDNVGRRPLEITTNREIAVLLQKHTSPPFIEKGGEILTAAATGNAAMVKSLLDRNPELVRSKTTSLFSTPLHWAAAKGYKEVVVLLLERGAPVNAQDLDGSTPLHEVAAYSSVEIAALLLTNGADVNLKD